MKRKTDLSQPPGNSPAEVAQGRVPHSNCAAAIESAGVLLVQAMQESDPPITQLSGALARMVAALSEMRTQVNHLPESSQAAASRAAVEALAREICVCIENLQFHDRLIQQLTQVRERLARLADHGIPESVPAAPVPAGSIELF
jgi:hypothetical protein